MIAIQFKALSNGRPFGSPRKLRSTIGSYAFDDFRGTWGVCSALSLLGGSLGLFHCFSQGLDYLVQPAAHRGVGNAGMRRNLLQVPTCQNEHLDKFLVFSWQAGQWHRGKICSNPNIACAAGKLGGAHHQSAIRTFIGLRQPVRHIKLVNAIPPFCQ